MWSWASEVQPHYSSSGETARWVMVTPEVKWCGSKTDDEMMPIAIVNTNAVAIGHS